MNMKNRLYWIPLSLAILAGCISNSRISIPKYTSINPISYTDVVYAGIRDTVLISTYSGRISRKINGSNEEKVISRTGMEIYSLAFDRKSGTIAASTLEEGILLINSASGKIIRKIPLKESWSNFILFSDDFRYLSALDQNGRTYVWDARNNYREINLPPAFPKGAIRSIDSEHVATVISRTAMSTWKLSNHQLMHTSPIRIQTFADMDRQGNYLSIDYNECQKYNAEGDSIRFSVRHPNWPLQNVENEKQIFDIPLSMQITSARFAQDKFYTSSIDRTIREWDKDTGKMLRSLSGHRGTVNKMKVSSDQRQLVSIDLKGGILFWDVEQKPLEQK